MAEGKMEMLWAIASNQMAMTANCNRDPKKRSSPFMPDEFNPLKRKKEVVIHDTKEAFALMKALWCKPKKEKA
jgi:hypothetical protein